MIVRDTENENDSPAFVAPTGLEFKIKDTKLYITVVTVSPENYKKLLEQLKSGFKRIAKWNKFRSQMSVQSNHDNLNYLTDPTFTRYLLSHFKELKKIMLKKSIKILFHMIMY